VIGQGELAKSAWSESNSCEQARGVAKGGVRGGAAPHQCRVRRHNKPVVGKMNWIKSIGNTWLSDWREVVTCNL
jgi:hypothetical protein